MFHAPPVALQIDSIEAEAGGKPVPFRLQLPGTVEFVSTASLVALTGMRFINTFVHAQVPDSKCNTVTAAASAQEAASVSKSAFQTPPATGKRTFDDMQQAGSHGTLGTAAKMQPEINIQQAAASDTPDALAQGMQIAPHVMVLMAAIMREEAPKLLPVADACALLEACKYCMADALLDHLPVYFKPMLQEVPIKQVRSHVLDAAAMAYGKVLCWVPTVDRTFQCS